MVLVIWKEHCLSNQVVWWVLNFTHVLQ